MKKGFTSAPLGLSLSLDRISEESGFEVRSDHDPLTQASYRILEARVLEILSNFKQRDAEVMKRILIDEWTERQVAKEKGLSQKTVNNIKNRIFPILQENLKDWKE